MRRIAQPARDEEDGRPRDEVGVGHERGLRPDHQRRQHQQPARPGRQRPLAQRPDGQRDHAGDEGDRRQVVDRATSPSPAARPARPPPPRPHLGPARRLRDDRPRVAVDRDHGREAEQPGDRERARDQAEQRLAPAHDEGEPEGGGGEQQDRDEPEHVRGLPAGVVVGDRAQLLRLVAARRAPSGAAGCRPGRTAAPRSARRRCPSRSRRSCGGPRQTAPRPGVMNAIAGPRPASRRTVAIAPPRLHRVARRAEQLAQRRGGVCPCPPRGTRCPRGAPARRVVGDARARRAPAPPRGSARPCGRRPAARPARRLALAHRGAGRSRRAQHRRVRSRSGVSTTRWSIATVPFGCGATCAGAACEALVSSPSSSSEPASRIDQRRDPAPRPGPLEANPHGADLGDVAGHGEADRPPGVRRVGDEQLVDGGLRGHRRQASGPPRLAGAGSGFPGARRR